MLALLGTALSAILSGGATGLLGIVLQRFFDFQSKKTDLELVRINNAHALALEDKATQRMQAEWTARAAITDKEVAGRIEEANQVRLGQEAEATAMVQQESYKGDKSTYLTGAVLRSKSRVVMWAMTAIDFLRGSVRPVLTLYLVYLTQSMYNDMQRLMAQYGQQLPVAIVQDLLLQIIATVLYLATVAVVWWFGTRPPAGPAASRR